MEPRDYEKYLSINVDVDDFNFGKKSVRKKNYNFHRCSFSIIRLFLAQIYFRYVSKLSEILSEMRLKVSKIKRPKFFAHNVFAVIGYRTGVAGGFVQSRWFTTKLIQSKRVKRGAHMRTLTNA